MIVDGRALAQDILTDVRKMTDGLESPLFMRAVTVSPTPATESYLRSKAKAAKRAGIEFGVIELPPETTTQEVIDAIKALEADAIIVQLPLPDGIDTDAVLAAIPLAQDADALTDAAHEAGEPVPPVASAIEEVLVHAGVTAAGKKAVVIGKGRLVGAPVALRLAALGAHVESYDVDTFTPDVLADADIIVSGAGVPHLVKPDMVKEGVVLIDAGTSEANGALVGDIDPACAEKASVFTPVPGGIGPLTVACLMRNTLYLTRSAE